MDDHYECRWEPIPPEEVRFKVYTWKFKDGTHMCTRLHIFKWKASVYLNGKLIALKYDNDK